MNTMADAEADRDELVRVEKRLQEIREEREKLDVPREPRGEAPNIDATSDALVRKMELDREYAELEKLWGRLRAQLGQQ